MFHLFYPLLNSQYPEHTLGPPYAQVLHHRIKPTVGQKYLENKNKKTASVPNRYKPFFSSQLPKQYGTTMYTALHCI